jgi:hypothetical protein
MTIQHTQHTQVAIYYSDIYIPTLNELSNKLDGFLQKFSFEIVNISDIANINGIYANLENQNKSIKIEIRPKRIDFYFQEQLLDRLDAMVDTFCQSYFPDIHDRNFNQIGVAFNHFNEFENEEDYKISLNKISSNVFKHSDTIKTEIRVNYSVIESISELKFAKHITIQSQVAQPDKIAISQNQFKNKKTEYGIGYILDLNTDTLEIPKKLPEVISALNILLAKYNDYYILKWAKTNESLE